jgi:hypothetical protein
MAIPRAVPEFHVSDFGTVLEFEVRNSNNNLVDLSTICGAEVLFMTPDGSSFTRPAQLAAADESGDPDGFDGLLFYVIQPGDLYVAGDWYFQVFIAFITGAWYSSVIQAQVFPNLFNVDVETLIP